MPLTPYRQLALQGAAIILVLSLAWPYFGWTAEAMPWRETALAIGGTGYMLVFKLDGGDRENSIEWSGLVDVSDIA